MRTFLCLISFMVMLAGCSDRQPDSDSAGSSTNSAQDVTVRSTQSMSASTEILPLASDTASGSNNARRPLVEFGNGNPVQALAVRGAAEAPQTGSITLNFVDTDIRQALKVIFTEVLKVNYSVHPSVKGTITLRTSQPITRDAMLASLENVLELNGAALIRDGNGYRVIPSEMAAHDGPPLEVGGSRLSHDEGYGLQIVPLHYVSAVEIKKVLDGVVAKDALIQADEARNVLLIGGSQQELSLLLDTIRSFDVDWLRSMSFGLFPLKYGAAKQVAEQLDKAFGQEAKGPTSGVLRFIPIEQVNAVMVIAPQRDYLARVEQWIERLDQSGDGTTRQVFVYYVNHAKATELARILAEIFGTGTSGAEPSRQELAPGLSPFEANSTDTGFGAAAFSQNLSNGTQQQGNGTPGQATSALGGSMLNGRPSESVSGGGSTAVDLKGESTIRVIADAKNNALVVYATPADYRLVEGAIKKLDIVPAQVMIEATIAEVTLTNDLRYGVRYFFNRGNSNVTLSDPATGTVAPQAGFSYVFSPGTGTKVVLDALENVTHVDVVSSPQLMVLDNETASLQVGDQVPIATQSAVSTLTSGAPVVNSIELLDTGVILQVTPRINPGGLVILDIRQQVSTPVATVTSQLNSPTIQQRQVRSTVAVQTGQTVALAGLIKQTIDREHNGIPLLASIPVLGNLFRQTSNDVDRTELLILLTPHVIRNSEEAASITSDLRSRLHALAPITPSGAIPSQGH